MNEELNGTLDNGERVPLEWMFEKQTELVRQPHPDVKLRDHLEKMCQQTLRLVDKLRQERGLTVYCHGHFCDGFHS
jgi:hypothetical protein